MEVDCVHCFIHNNKRFVVDGNSGSVHVVDEPAYKIVEAVKHGVAAFSQEKLIRHFSDKYTVDTISEAYQELNHLVKQDMLFSPDFTDNPALPESVVKALCLNVAHDCDLRCEYCFASTGDFGGKRELMSIEVAKQAVDFLIKSSKNRQHLELDFFGGEPLLNWDVVKQTVQYGEEQAEKHAKKFRFTLTTNGIGLNDEIIDFLNEKMFNVVLSLDGRKEVNDRIRKTISGKGSVYNVIVPKFQQLVRKRHDQVYYVRGTFTKHNLDFANDVIHLADLGFESISLEPVVTDPDQEFALTDEDVPEIIEEYHRLADKMLYSQETDKPFQFFHYNIELRKGPCLYKRLAGCGAGHEYVAVTPSGELYPCHQFVGKDEYKIGTVWQGLTRLDIMDRFKQAHVLNKPECRKCWAKYYCSGGCHANNIEYGGGIEKPFAFTCHLERKRIECGFYLTSVLDT